MLTYTGNEYLSQSKVGFVILPGKSYFPHTWKLNIVWLVETVKTHSQIHTDLTGYFSFKIHHRWVCVPDRSVHVLFDVWNPVALRDEIYTHHYPCRDVDTVTYTVTLLLLSFCTLSSVPFPHIRTSGYVKFKLRVLESFNGVRECMPTNKIISLNKYHMEIKSRNIPRACVVLFYLHATEREAVKDR